MESLQRIAVLIDSDNTQIGKLENVMREISTYAQLLSVCCIKIFQSHPLL